MFKTVNNKKGFMLIFALGVLAVLFIVVFSVAGLAGNNIIQTSNYALSKSALNEAEFLANMNLKMVKINQPFISEYKSSINKQFNISAEISDYSSDNTIFSSGLLIYKNGDKMININVSSVNTKITYEYIYIINAERNIPIFISQKVMKMKGDK